MDNTALVRVGAGGGAAGLGVAHLACTPLSAMGGLWGWCAQLPFPGSRVSWAVLHTARGILPTTVARPRGTEQEKGVSLGTAPKKRASHPAGSHSQLDLRMYTHQTCSSNTSFSSRQLPCHPHCL